MALSVRRERIVFSGLLGLGSRRRGCRICHRWHLSLSVWCHRHPLNTTSAGATFILSPRENAPSWLGPLSQVKARFVAGEAYSDSQHPRLATGVIYSVKGPAAYRYDASRICVIHSRTRLISSSWEPLGSRELSGYLKGWHCQSFGYQGVGHVCNLCTKIVEFAAGHFSIFS